MKTKDFENKEEIIEEVTPKARPKKYIITVTNLALREGPGKDYEKIGLAEAGQTFISEIKDGFGRLADGSGWVCMDYLRKAD